MARFKLLAGQHIDGKPNPKFDPKNPELEPRKIRQTFKAGEVVESEKDLVAKFGREKFQFLGGSVKDAEPVVNDSQFPNGQVSSGHQVSTSGPNGTTIAVLDKSRPVDDGLPEGKLKPAARGQNTAADTARAKQDAIEPEFDAMTVAELREYAEEKEIDLSGAHRKDEIIQAIRDHMSEN